MSAIQLFDLNGEQRFTGTSLGGVQSATKTLTDAQIKALPTTSGSAPYGFPILASPGATTVILPIGGAIIKYGTSAYTNVDVAAFFEIGHSGFNGASMSPDISVGDVGGLLDTTVNEIAVLPLTGWSITTPPSPARPTGLASQLDAMQGLGLILSADNAAAGDFTGGNAANRLVIQLLYTVLNV